MVGVARRRTTVAAAEPDEPNRQAVATAAKLLVEAGHDTVTADPRYPTSLGLRVLATWFASAYRESQQEMVVAKLQAAAPLLEDAGITAVLEPLNVLVDHAGYYLVSTAQGLRIVDEVGSPNVKLLFDVYHQQISEGMEKGATSSIITLG